MNREVPEAGPEVKREARRAAGDPRSEFGLPRSTSHRFDDQDL